MSDHDHDDSPLLANLTRENHQLRTWLAGFIAKCPGCIQDATEWANSIGLHHHSTPDTDKDEPITI